LISTITTVDTTNGTISAVPALANYTVTTMTNADATQPGKPTQQVTYKKGVVDSVSFFSGQTWDDGTKSWLISTITTVDTTNGTISAVPALANYTVTTMTNADATQPGKPTQQVTYKKGVVDSVSFFSGQTWDDGTKSWLISTITTVDTTNGTISAVPALANYTVTTMTNADATQPGKPTQQVTYKKGVVDSVSFFSGQTWDDGTKSWLISTITTVDTTNGTISAVPALANYTVTTMTNADATQPGKTDAAGDL